MDQFDAFQYFITNLLLHNVVLVLLAGALGVVLGRLVFGNARAESERHREVLAAEKIRGDAAERDLEKVESGQAELLEQVEGLEGRKAELEAELSELKKDGGAGDGTEQVKKLQSATKALEQRVIEAEAAVGEAEKRHGAEMAAKIEELEGRPDGPGSGEESALLVALEGELEEARRENERLAKEVAEGMNASAEKDGELKASAEEWDRLEEELAAARERVEELESDAKKAKPATGLPTRRGSKADIEDLEKRIAVATKEREQVEKASAVLRKEMRGLRNKVKEVEQHDSHECELEQTLKETEERLTRAQATVAKESRVKTSLEKMVEELEWKLAEAETERKRLREEIELARDNQQVVDSGGAAGAAAALRGELEGDDESSPEPDAAGAAEDLRSEVPEPAPAVDGDGDRGGEDELMRIKGIGAVLAKKLRASGVTSLRQIADWTDEDLKEYSKKLRLRNRAERGRLAGAGTGSLRRGVTGADRIGGNGGRSPFRLHRRGEAL